MPFLFINTDLRKYGRIGICHISVFTEMLNLFFFSIDLHICFTFKQKSRYFDVRIYGNTDKIEVILINKSSIYRHL